MRPARSVAVRSFSVSISKKNRDEAGIKIQRQMGDEDVCSDTGPCCWYREGTTASVVKARGTHDTLTKCRVSYGLLKGKRK